MKFYPGIKINVGVRKSFLQEDYRMSLSGTVRPDCREQCYACGILAAFSGLRRAQPGGGWKCP